VSRQSTIAINRAIRTGRTQSVHVSVFAGSVLETFESYTHRVAYALAPEDLFDPEYPEHFPAGGPCYAYLFSAAMKQSETFWKIGITRNIAGRYSHFACGLPPAFSTRCLRALLFNDQIYAEQCEESLLVACRHLWVGGEWLLEHATAGLSKEATDGPHP
jgi:hypothetical protein